ncbi:MAG: glycosyl hydrolase family 25 [Prevotella sp.]|nr:glycosyl hydrolase family 25 [Prevotella sp.]
MKHAETNYGVAALLLIAAIGIGCWQLHRLTYHPPVGIGANEVVLVHHRPGCDSISRQLAAVSSELDELHYYLSVHGVQDEGFGLIAQRASELQAVQRQLARKDGSDSTTQYRKVFIPGSRRLFVAVKAVGGRWYAGHWDRSPLSGKGLTTDSAGRTLRGIWDADTLVSVSRTDSLGVYKGQLDSLLRASGQGKFCYNDGNYYEGYWLADQRSGFGYLSSPLHHVRAGEWKADRYLGERLTYTSERIYGIDISRHQHEKGRKRYAIQWNQLRITHLGTLSKKRVSGEVNYPVSFVYIKATEGTTIRNKYFASDYQQAKRQGIRVGCYHFFSLKSSAAAQADYFVKNSTVRKGDFPPVLDVEPSDAQIAAIGTQELFNRIRTWMRIVEKRTGIRPILYISQSFVNRYLPEAPDVKRDYKVWIARYGEYKPDVKLVYWQLCPDGRVSGITGPVDINVFNGYQGQYDEFLRTATAE